MEELRVEGDGFLAVWSARQGLTGLRLNHRDFGLDEDTTRALREIGTGAAHGDALR